MKKEILTDPIYEKTISELLNRTLDKVQAVVTTWLKFDFGPVDSVPALYELIHSPEIPYQEGVNRLKAPKEGIPSELAIKHAEGLKVPDPGEFYKLAKQAAGDVYATRELSLFQVVKGKVVFNDQAKDQIIKHKSVFIETPGQETFCNDLSALVTQLNDLNRKLDGQLLTENSSKLSSLFAVPVREVPGYFEVGISPEGLRNVLKKIR